MENHHFSWENSLFLWPCSIAMLVCQRVNEVKSYAIFGGLNPTGQSLLVTFWNFCLIKSHFWWVKSMLFIILDPQTAWKLPILATTISHEARRCWSEKINTEARRCAGKCIFYIDRYMYIYLKKLIYIYIIYKYPSWLTGLIIGWYQMVRWDAGSYPLVNIQNTMERSTIFVSKRTWLQ